MAALNGQLLSLIHIYRLHQTGLYARHIGKDAALLQQVAVGPEPLDQGRGCLLYTSEETARCMAARGLLQSDRIATLDLALYPDSGAEKLFLQDLYAALHAPGEIPVSYTHLNTALLFDVHPVGHSVLGALLALDGTGGLDGSPVQQQRCV